jgi:hypothetical protein
MTGTLTHPWPRLKKVFLVLFLQKKNCFLNRPSAAGDGGHAGAGDFGEAEGAHQV